MTAWWIVFFGWAAFLAVESDEVEDLVRLEISRLADRQASTRRSAVRRLSELGTTTAWTAVQGALLDPEPEVADEAQLSLAGVLEPEIVERWFGRAGLKAKDELVRERVAEVFGRLRVGVDGIELAQRTRKKPVRVARMLAWSIERQALAGRLDGEPERIARELAKSWRLAKDPGVRAAVWMALGAVEHEEAAALIANGSGERAPELRAAALLVARDQPDRGVALARARLDDPATSVRATVLEVLEQAANRDAVSLLVERLECEPSRRLALRILEALRRLSGLKHRADPRPWKDWLASLPDDWRAVRKPETLASAEVRRSRTLERLPILSDRIAILIDLSGSIWRERDDGRTRKQAIDEELRRAFEALSPDTSFALIPYTTTPIAGSETLRPAKPRAVEAALTWFEGLRASGRGNVYDAIQLALADEEVDTVLILSDGAPTGGHRWNLELMVDLLIEQNRFRRVAFDHVLVDASGGRARHWKRLASASGGRVVEVER